MIANSDFGLPGARPGEALGWTLRSFCTQEAIAAFFPEEPTELFARWTAWSFGLAAPTRAPFAPTGTAERFDAWPSPLFAVELSAGAVNARLVDGFAEGWADGALFAWSGDGQVAGRLGSTAREGFEAWRPLDRFLVAFDDAALARAMLRGAPSELFDGAGWATKNLTL